MNSSRSDPSEANEEAAYRKARQYMDGTSQDPYTELDDLEPSSLETAKAEMEEAMQTANDSPADRLKANLKYAFYRDLRYALAGGTFLRGLGVFHNIRNVYELQKLARAAEGGEE